jgi:hypothetical protein
MSSARREPDSKDQTHPLGAPARRALLDLFPAFFIVRVLGTLIFIATWPALQSHIARPKQTCSQQRGFASVEEDAGEILN